MAVQRRVNWISQQRVDVPDMRAVESAASNDFDQLIQGLITNTSQGYILRGFEISMTGAIGGAASSLQMLVDPGAVLHILASQSGTMLQVPSGTAPQQLNGATNPNISGAFVPNALNYVGLDYVRFIDPTTSAQVYIWDPTTNSETTKTAPRAQVLQYQLSISTTSWPSNLLPIAIVQTDAGNNVVAITDCRWLLFRLGTGGASPDPFFAYPWNAQPSGRTENPPSSSSNGSNPFEGGDKMLFSLKDWMNAVMSSFLEIKGTTYWYSQSSAGSISKLREDLGNTITTGPGTIAHGVLPNNNPVLTTTISITSGMTSATLASTVGLTNGNTYFIFATGIPYGTTIIYAGSPSVTLSNPATVTNASANVSLFDPASVTQPGQVNWSDPIYLDVIGSALTYVIAANPTSTDIVLLDDQVAYITLTRDVPVVPNLFFTYNSIPNTTTVVSIGSVPWTASLLPGDFVRAAADSDSLYTKIKTVDSSSQVTLFGNYVPFGQTAAGVKSFYSFGSYAASASPSGPRDIFITSRALVPSGQNVWWLLAREDNSGVNPTVFVRFIGQELDMGSSNQIDDGIPKQLLQYIGTPSESSSRPQYVSALNPGSVPQITQITTGSAATVASNQYFLIYSSGNSRRYAVWINKDGTGVQPNVPGISSYLEWDITTGQTANQTASSLAALLRTTPEGDFGAVSALAVVTVTNSSAGTCFSAVNGTVGAPFAISVTQSGTGVGNFAITDGDNLTVSIKKLDESISDIASLLDSPSYDETVDIVASGATPPTSLNGPVFSGTNITLPNNSREGSAPQFYTVGNGVIEVYLNGQYLRLGDGWSEVGISQSASNQIQILQDLVVGDYLEFRLDATGGPGGGGGGPGPAGPPGPQGPPGVDEAGGPIAISTKTNNYSVMLGDNFLRANCASNPILFSLPTAASAVGRIFYFKKVDVTANTMTVQASGIETIDGSNTVFTSTQYDEFTLISNGTSWDII